MFCIFGWLSSAFTIDLFRGDPLALLEGVFSSDCSGGFSESWRLRAKLLGVALLEAASADCLAVGIADVLAGVSGISLLAKKARFEAILSRFSSPVSSPPQRALMSLVVGHIQWPAHRRP